MSSKEVLLNALSVTKLRALAKDNDVSLVVKDWILGDSTATTKEDIIAILSKSRKITFKKIDAQSGTTKKSTVAKTAKRPKRMRILAHDRSVILERQNKKCDECGKDLNLIHRLYEIDHKEGLADGGADSLENYHALCLECHRKKTRKETTTRAKTKRQSSVASTKSGKVKTVYKCKASVSDRDWICNGKKSASRSCLKTGFFDEKCEHLQVTRE